MVALLIAVIAAAFWPGVPMYDTVGQYDQVVSDDVADWHPPAMVRLWQVLHPLGDGTVPMFVLQVALYAAGFALVVSALEREGRRVEGVAVALLAVCPLLLGWEMVVLKDAQMLGALIAAFGIVAHFRLRGARLPPLAGAGALVLIGYATLVRANAMFATIPLAAFIFERPRHPAVRAAVAIVTILVLLAVQPLLNQRVFGATPSGVAKSQPLFDLAAIAVAVPSSVPPFTPAERRLLIEKHCVKSFFWDPIGDPGVCGPVTDRANELPERELYLDLARAVLAHPLIYAEHRVKHWNSTERWLVRPGLIDAAPPRQGEPNEEGLNSPKGPFVVIWQDLAARQAGTPLGWPIAWTALSLLIFPIAWRRRLDAEGGLALALVVSTIILEASFLVISIASDLRYHLWTLAAPPLALILLAHRWRPTRSQRFIGATFIVVVIGGGILTRVVFPNAPATYQAMLRGPGA